MIIFKDEDTMCGPACVELICKNENKQVTINKNEIWCCSIADILQQTGFNVKVKCFNSRLYNDCFKFPNQEFEGFKTIRNFLKNNYIVEEEPTISNVKNEIKNNKYVIFNVSSKIFNKDNNMTGGHYILATNIKGDIVTIINPRETDFETKRIPIIELIHCIKDFGSWRILIS